MPGVEAAYVRTVEDVGLELKNGDQATARVISSAGPAATLNAVHIEKGRFPAPVQERGAAQHAVRHRHGDRARRRAHTAGGRTSASTCASSGIGIDPENLYAMQSEGNLPAPGTFAVVYTTEEGVEQLFGTSHSGNDIAVKAEPGVDIDELAERGRGRAQLLRRGHRQRCGRTCPATRAWSPNSSRTS